MPVNQHKLKHITKIGKDEALRYLLAELSDIDEDYMTSFELRFIRLFSDNAPSYRRSGIENLILNK